jgi:hypothetical protein
MKTDMGSQIFLDFSHTNVPDIVKPSSDITRKIQQIWLIKWENVKWVSL